MYFIPIILYVLQYCHPAPRAPIDKDLTGELLFRNMKDMFVGGNHQQPFKRQGLYELFIMVPDSNFRI